MSVMFIVQISLPDLFHLGRFNNPVPKSPFLLFLALCRLIPFLISSMAFSSQFMLISPVSFQSRFLSDPFVASLLFASIFCRRVLLDPLSPWPSPYLLSAVCLGSSLFFPLPFLPFSLLSAACPAVFSSFRCLSCRSH